MDLVQQELYEGVKINQHHNFFGYVSPNYLSSNNQTRDLFTDAGQDEQIQNWLNNFHQERIIANTVVVGSDGVSIAELYRNNMRGSKGSIATDLHQAMLDEASPKPIDHLIYWVRSINFETPNIHTYAFLAWLKDKRAIPFIVNDDSMRFMKDRVRPNSLIEFAPYTAYVYTVTLLYGFNLLRNKNINKKLKHLDSDWMDLNYIFYFPFIDCFASSDKFFKNFIDQFPRFDEIQIINNNC